MKKITIWLFALFAFTQVNAQLFTIDECLATVSSSTYGPMYSIATAGANNRSAALYPSSQLTGIAGQTLNTLYYKRLTATGAMAGTPNFKVYMKEVSISDYGTGALDWATEIATATLVYDSDPSATVGSTDGWKNFPMSTNFVYSGTQNLAVFTEYVNTTASASIGWAYEFLAPCITTSNSNTGKYSNNTSGTFSTTLGSSDYRRPLIGFDFVVSCNAPNTLVSSNITTSSIDLSWTENAIQPQNGYEYYNSTSSTPPSPTETPTGTTTTGVTTVSLSTLTPATNYYFWVRGNCGSNDKSIWVGPLAYSTLCVDVAAFVENFDTSPTGVGNLPVCWSKFGTSNNVYTNTGASAPMSPSNRLYMNISSTTTTFAVMPPVSNLQANTHRLRFKAYATTANKILSVGYFTTPGDETTYVELDPFQMPSTTIATTQEFTVIPTTIPAGVSQLVFTIPEGTATTIYIDDVKWEVNSSCVEPTALTASMITNSGATLGWTNGGLETVWDIQYGLAGFSLGSGTLMSGVTTNPQPVTSLMGNTSYEFYVRGVCTGPENSSWSGPFLFKTQCDDLTEYSEDFEAYATGSANPLPDCWGRLGNANLYITTGSVAPMSPSKRLYLNASGTTPTEAIAVLPSVSNLQLNTHRLKFIAYATATNRFLSIGYLTDPSNALTFIQIEEVFLPATASSTALEFIITPTGIPAGVKNLAIKNPGSPAGTTTAYVDDVRWEAIPACPEATTLNATNLLSTSADLNWTEMGSASLWNIEYGPVGYTQGTGGTLVSGVNTNPYTLTGLTPATTYDYYVQADCGGTAGVSIWSGPFTFTTACTSFTAPYDENFDGLALTTPYTELPTCWDPQVGPDFWDVTNGTTNSPQYLPGVVDHTTGTSNFMWIDSSSDITANEMVSPLIDMSTLTAPYAGFWFASNNVTNTINHTITLDVWDGASWVNIAMETGNFTDWIQVAGAVPSTIPTITKFRIYAIANPTGTTADYFQNDLGIDDFFVKETPSCPMPSNLTAASITASSAELSWTENGSATLWNIEYGPSGYTQGTGGTVVTGVATNPYILTTLLPATSYDYYLQSDCGGTSGTSSWVGPFSFTTECTVFTAPFTEGFENGGTIPNCWTMSGGEDWLFSNTTGINHIGNNGTLTGSTVTNNYFAWVDDSGTPPNDVTLTSPLINISSLTLPRLTFFEISNNEGQANATLKVEVYDGATWNLMGTYNTNTSNGWEKKTINLSTLTFSGDAQVRFIIEGSTSFYDDIAIDDVTIDESPSSSPVCATNFVATPNTSCGNEVTVITWDAAALADGYYITMGTTTGGNDILNNVDIGAVPNYSHVGEPNTTYYYTISPYNTVGSASGCTEQSFATAVNGCYCFPTGTSSASYIDNFTTTLGTTNITNNASGFSTNNYGDFTSLSTTLGSTQSFDFNVGIVGATVGCAIWIDWNNDFSFDASDMVFSTTSYGSGPFTGTVTIPAATTSGNYRMRVLIDFNDSNPGNDDACSFQSGRGEVEDYTITVDNTLANQDFDNVSFIAYPNPVKDVLNLSYSSEITSIQVINLLGQEVISKNVGTTSTQIDMSELSVGSYLVKVTIDDISKIIKVIKQ